MGIINYVRGGLPSWWGYHIIIFTNRRVILASVDKITKDEEGKPSLPEILWKTGFGMFKDEVDLGTLSSMSPDEILITDKTSFAIRYDQIESFNVSKDKMVTHFSFFCNRQHYDFEAPNNQYNPIHRLHSIYSAFREMKNCQKCRGELSVRNNGTIYCAKCKTDYYLDSARLKGAYLEEKRVMGIKNNRIAGGLLIFCGAIFLIAILNTLMHLASIDMLKGSFVCLPAGLFALLMVVFPVFVIIIGILVLFGERAGKILFGVFCIMFAIPFFIAPIIMFYNGEDGAFYFGVLFYGVGIGSASYGYFIIKGNIRKKSE